MSKQEASIPWEWLRPTRLADMEAEWRPETRAATPEQTYVDVLFWTMAQEGRFEWMLQAPLPGLTCPDGTPVQTPDFHAVIEWLRRLIGAPPPGIGGSRNMGLNGVSYRIGVEFKTEPAACRILMEREK